jgi:hypothetical protein
VSVLFVVFFGFSDYWGLFLFGRSALFVLIFVRWGSVEELISYSHQQPAIRFRAVFTLRSVVSILNIHFLHSFRQRVLCTYSLTYSKDILFVLFSFNLTATRGHMTAVSRDHAITAKMDGDHATRAVVDANYVT